MAISNYNSNRSHTTEALVKTGRMEQPQLQNKGSMKTGKLEVTFLVWQKDSITDPKTSITHFMKAMEVGQ